MPECLQAEPGELRQLLSARQQRVLAYAQNVFRQINHLSREAKPLLRWCAEYGHALGLDIDEDIEDHVRRRGRRDVPTPEAWQMLVDTLGSVTVKADLEYHPLLDAIGKMLHLRPAEVAILQLSVDYYTSNFVEELWDSIAGARGRRASLTAEPGLFSLLTGVSYDDAAQHIRMSAPLRAAGLITNDRYGVLQILDRLLRALREPGSAKRDPFDVLFGKVAHATLQLKDFAHLGQDVQRITALLHGALTRGETGVHVLLYGEPGTGKTELAKTLAASLGVPLRLIAEADEDGDEPSRQDRLAELRLAQQMLPGTGKALILFDEAEDLFGPPKRSFFDDDAGPSRVYIHRLLEESKLPVIWTANDIGRFGSAVLRRMSCCLEVRVPPPAARAHLWAKAANDAGVAVPVEEFGRLAGMLPAAPALARSAMRVASMAGGDADTVRWALSGIMRAMNNGKLPLAAAGEGMFEPALLAADVDLGALAERLAKADAPRNVSLLLSGPPGSGKSAYARHLANRMGLPVLFRRASDLLDKYVGETEKQIAAAFAEAVDTNSFLIFDEADSLIADRRGAVRNWEVSQTNEMLTWMERHPLPFCCTTNFADRLDEAAMRRFLVKAQFGFLRPEQVALAFRQIFQLAPPAGLAALDRLTPADFDLVKRGAVLQGTMQDPEALLDALRREQRAKAGGSNPIGFRLSA